MLRLNCFFTAAEGRYNEALEAAIALTARSRRHAGCISYDVYESATTPDAFAIIETWADQPSLDAHSATPEFAEYVGIMNDCGTLTLDVLQK